MMQKHLVITTSALLLFAASQALVLGQAKESQLPRFEDYLVNRSNKALGEIIWIGRPDADESDAQFRKRIRDAARKGPNFAGHHSIVGSSCGMICINLVVVNVKTGKIYDTPFMGIGDGPCPVGFFENKRELLHFKANSRLLILRGSAEDHGPGNTVNDARCSTRYYVWKSNNLVLVKEIFPAN